MEMRLCRYVKFKLVQENMTALPVYNILTKDRWIFGDGRIIKFWHPLSTATLFVSSCQIGFICTQGPRHWVGRESRLTFDHGSPLIFK